MSERASDQHSEDLRGLKNEKAGRMAITEQQAVDRFVAKFPRAFDDPGYRKQERDYKWDAHRRVAAELLSVHGRRIVAEGPPDALVKTLKTLIHQTNLLSTYELIALNDAFKDQKRAARKFADAVLKLVDEGGERAFSRLVEATGSLPADPGRARGVDLAGRDDSAVPGEARRPHVPQAEADTEDR